MDEKELNEKKDELAKYYAEKIGLTRETLEADFKNRLEIAAKFQEPERIALSMLKTYYKKQELSLQNTVGESGVFLGFDSVIDWAEIARRKGEKDMNGIDIYPSDHPFLAGKPIPDHDYSRKIYVFSSEKTGMEIKPPQLKTVILRGEKALKDYSSFLYKIVDFRAVKGKTDTSLYGAPGTEFTIINELENPHEFIVKHFKNQLIQNLAELDKKTTENNIPFCVVKGNVVEIRQTQGRSDLLRISDDSLGLSSEGIQCWIPRGQIDFPIETQDLIVMGSAVKNKDGDTIINAFSVWCAPEWKVKPKQLRDEDDADPMDEVW